MQEEIEKIVYHDSVEAPDTSQKVTCTCGADFDYEAKFILLLRSIF